MFERFTHDARATVMGAVGEAERRGDRHVGTEHLLLGAIASAHPIVSAALADAGVDLLRTRSALDACDVAALAAVGVEVRAMPAAADLPARRSYGRVRRSGGHRPFTGGAKQVLEAALREALQRGDRHIGSEHILLGLAARPAPDPAHELLNALEVDSAALYADLQRRFRDAA